MMTERQQLEKFLRSASRTTPGPPDEKMWTPKGNVRLEDWVESEVEDRFPSCVAYRFENGDVAIVNKSMIDDWIDDTVEAEMVLENQGDFARDQQNRFEETERDDLQFRRGE